MRNVMTAARWKSLQKSLQSRQETDQGSSVRASRVETFFSRSSLCLPPSSPTPFPSMNNDNRGYSGGQRRGQTQRIASGARTAPYSVSIPKDLDLIERHLFTFLLSLHSDQRRQGPLIVKTHNGLLLSYLFEDLLARLGSLLAIF